MSYRGKPSKGCKRCVAKKVKCDQTHPVCQRCMKANSVCEYRDLFELVHRSQTQAAERMAKDKWRQRALKTVNGEQQPSVSPCRKSVSPETLIAVTTMSTPTSISLRPSLERLAYMRFVFDFASSQVASPTRQQGAFEPLARLFEASPPDSLLHHTINAVALANFGGRFKSADATTQGAICYGKALSCFAAAVGGPKERLGTEEAMLGIFLLSIYEMLTSPKFDGTYRMHQNGGLSVLRERWNDGTMKDGYKNRYLSAIYNQLVMNALSEGQAPPAFDPAWNLYDTDSPRGELTELMHTAALSRYKLRKETSALASSVQSVTSSCIAADHVLEEALDIDARLEEWHRRSIIKGSWIADPAAPIHPEKRVSWARDLFLLPGAPQVMHVYRNVVLALTENLYRGGRLFLNMSVLQRATQRAASSPFGSKQKAYFETLASATAAMMIELVEGICLSIPSLLQLGTGNGKGDPATPDEIYGFRGLLMFWPLIAATIALTQQRVQELDINLRRAWIFCVMAFLRNNLGLAKAEAFNPASMMVQPPPYPESALLSDSPPGLAIPNS